MTLCPQKFLIICCSFRCLSGMRVGVWGWRNTPKAWWILVSFRGVADILGIRSVPQRHLSHIALSSNRKNSYSRKGDADVGDQERASKTSLCTRATLLCLSGNCKYFPQSPFTPTLFRAEYQQAEESSYSSLICKSNKPFQSPKVRALINEQYCWFSKIYVTPKAWTFSILGSNLLFGNV